MTDPLEIPVLGRPVDAVASVRGSKSLTNRWLVVAALADGDSLLRGVLDGDDTRHMVEALRTLGFELQWDRDAETIRVSGGGGRIPASLAELYGGNAGTTVRFLVSLVALGRGSFHVDGDARMRERPIHDLLDGLAALGVSVRSEHGNGCPPVTVEADGIPGGSAIVSGETSSQFASSILLAAPHARRDVVLEIRGRLVGAPFVEMTLGVMRAAGAEVEREEGRLRVRAGRGYRGGDRAVEPDATAASYFLALPLLVGGRVTVPGLGADSLQGDLAFTGVLADMGARVDLRPDGITVEEGELRGVEHDFRDISDTFLTAAVLAPFASSPSVITGIEHTRRQESDRVAAVAHELSRLGARVEERRDALVIHPSRLHGADVETYGDHRIAMSFALVGLRVPGVRIRDPGCVAKTFPDYFERLGRLIGDR
ncbi:MAG: 3-phosphoshikimate 1-carboxyvinyltransferase [Candidatus Binatota bacterium]|nr:3-phosphoshikimate 1-carboxyvinyltransferase [Candidatus Binatota bacterium]